MYRYYYLKHFELFFQSIFYIINFLTLCAWNLGRGIYFKTTITVMLYSIFIDFLRYIPYDTLRQCNTYLLPIQNERTEC